MCPIGQVSAKNVTVQYCTRPKYATQLGHKHATSATSGSGDSYKVSCILTRTALCVPASSSVLLPSAPAMYTHAALKFALLAQLASLASATYSDPKVLDACPGYQAKNVFNYGHKLTADLLLGGTACNVFGNDTEKLKLEVTYENRESSLHFT